MIEIKLVENWQNLVTKQPPEPEPINWYAEPFTKRSGCNTPGQCGDDCDCGCPYNSMSELEQLPLIADIERAFPNEWLAFIISPTEDEEFTPHHGKLVAHSPNPNELYDAVNTVLWNQHVYVYFNGDFAAMQQSYGASWDAPATPPARRTHSGPQQLAEAAQKQTSPEPLPATLADLIYSAIDELYDVPHLNKANRRLRLARVRAVKQANQRLTQMLDEALDLLEGPLPRVDEIIWFLEETLLDLEQA